MNLKQVTGDKLLFTVTKFYMNEVYDCIQVVTSSAHVVEMICFQFSILFK